jgi:hypothetical protein
MKRNHGLTLILSMLLLIAGIETKAQCATPTSTIVNNTNCTTPNGTITFTAPTPTANYLFSIDGGITFGASGQTIFTGLFGGDYPTVSKNIASGCISTVTVKTLTNPAPPVAPTSAVINNTNCITPNGRITFSAPTPVSSYAFSIDGGNTFGTAGQTIFNGLSGGNYPTVVKHITRNCVSAIAVKTITNPAITAPTSTVLNVTNCNTPNGRITFTAPTPIGNYVFSINNGATYGTAGQTIFNALAAGTYVTRAKLVSTGCVSPAVNKVVANPTVTAPTSAVINVTNCNTPNGRITFSAPTPLANYQFSINGGTTYGTAGQAVFNGLAAGTYVTKAKLISSGCVSASVNKIISNPVVTAPVSTVLNPTNCNVPNGRITFTGPTPLASYQFSVDGGLTYGTAGQTIFNGLAAGNRSTRARLVSSGCVSAAVVKALANPVITAPTSTVTTSSCSTPTGSITFTGPTPLANYAFSTDGGATYGTAGQVLFNGLAAGTYSTRTKLVSTGCVSAAANKVITTTAVAIPVSSVINVTDCNTPNGSITFTGPTPLANYQFSIDGGTTFGAAGVVSFTGLDDGTYSTRARLVSSGCVSTAVNKTITKPTITIPASTVTNVTTCATPNGRITFTGPTPLANYQFSIDGGLSFEAPGVVIFQDLNRGTYQTVSKLASSGCVSAVVNKIVNAPVTAGVDKSICQEQTVAMTATATAGASWRAEASNPATTVFTNAASAVSTINGFTLPGTYNFIWETASCADTVSVEVTDCASPLNCANFGYLFQSVSGSGTDFISVNLKTGASTIIRTDITTAPVGINAIGYNVTDGHLWGSVVGGPVNTIARIGADGVPVYFTIPGLVSTGYNVGTVDDNGVLYLYTSSTTDIYRVDVNPASPTYLTLLSPVLTTTAMSIADFAYNPVDNMIYGVNTNGAAPIHQLLRINPNTGGVTIVGTVTSSHAPFNNGSFGAAYLDANGNLYVSDNVAGGIYRLPVTQTIFGNTTAQLFSQGAISAGNDGALCHYACVKPEAGSDTTICSTGIATMSATEASGIQWVEVDGNPGTSIIQNPAAGNTTISGFSAAGEYKYLWNNGGLCNDTASIIVYNCIVDTVTAEPSCNTLVIEPTQGSIPPSETTVYSTCGLDPSEQTQGTLTIENGYAIWTPIAPQNDTISSCIVTCNGSICDTTFVLIAPCNITLPVTLVRFEVKEENCNAALSWTSAEELNVSHYELQSSIDGSMFQTIARLTPTGSNSTYAYKDGDLGSPIIFYRLRMVDIDGSARYSSIKMLRITCAQPAIRIYPNPAQDIVTVSGLMPQSRVRLIDATGKTITEIAATGSTQEMSVRGLANTSYLLQVIHNNKIVKSIKLIKR